VDTSSIFHPNTATANQRQGGQTLRLARTLIAQTLAYCAKHESKTLETVRAHLMELVYAKPPLGQGQNLRSAHLLLGRYAPQFNEAFQKSLAAMLREELGTILPQQARPAQPNAADDALQGMSLSLIDVGEVERVLLLDRVSQRFGARYEATLEPLTQRLSVLFGRETTSIHDNPFQPVVLLRAFIAAWELCGWDPEATNDLAQSLQPEFWLDLAPLYSELNGTLLRAGVPAQRPLRVRPAVSASAPLGTDARGQADSGRAPLDAGTARHSGFAPVDGSAGSAWGALGPVGRTVAAHARQFLQRLGLGRQAGGYESATGPSDDGSAYRPAMAAASPTLMGFLGGLQADASAAESYQWAGGQAPANANVLRQMREHDEVRRATELDRGTVDALAEVFDYVFAERAIPMQMKVIIGRLQIPVLKAAMIDRDFFLSDKHPARQLVDTLAGASVAWVPAKGEHDPLYVRIEKTVQRVLTEFEDDLSLYVDLLQEFTEFLFETEQQARARVEPVVQKERQGESLDQALAHVDEVVHARIKALSADAPLAAFLLPFLTNPWREVMARAWMDEATRDKAFAQTLATMEQLIWSVQPKTTSEERRQLVAVLPEMVRQLNLGLDHIEWNGKPRADFTRRLITTHTLAIRLTQPVSLDSGSAALEEREGKAAMQQLDARLAATHFAKEDTFDAQVQNFQRGMWFDVMPQAGTQIRCRLSWVSPMRTRLLFTNREGYDAFVRSEREVASMLRAGTMLLLDHEAIVGRAIEKIMVADELAMAD
jgi:hypothetical protein